jgi:hypothetical protein
VLVEERGRSSQSGEPPPPVFLLPQLLNFPFLAHSHLHTTSDCLDKFALHKETKDQSIRKRERERQVTNRSRGVLATAAMGPVDCRRWVCARTRQDQPGFVQALGSERRRRSTTTTTPSISLLLAGCEIHQTKERGRMQAIRVWAGGMMMYKKNDMREKEREREELSSPTESINQASKLACKVLCRT